jgi:hypothetical protein
VTNHHIDYIRRVGLVHMEVYAEGLIRELLHPQNIALHLLGRNRRTGQKTKATCIATSGNHPGVGNPTHCRLDDRIFAAQ